MFLKNNFGINLHYHSDATKSTDSFSEFEEMWLQMGEDLEKSAFGPPYIPTPPSPSYHTTFRTIAKEDESLKRPSSPTPENQVDSSSSDAGRFSHVEDSILTNLRRTNPVKLQQLENRMREPGLGQVTVSDFKEQFEIVQSLMTRVENDCAQMKIIMNFIEDTLIKKRAV
ncbi:uncharacterized protein LOC130049099 [Ostrea edulis]|uniref:uncharacterized protein LOC130049099 n=1 Tax=Ostrea edulis TaxID=37623 RepID=UPI0024AEA8E7|nr:uncharacterized protein LOC130049099 [Ostrea edulis]